MSSPTNTVALLGATGLIGSHLLRLLLQDSYFTDIRVIVRRPLAIKPPNVTTVVIDFADEAAFREAIAGCNIIFSAIGTTQSRVKGDKAAYRRVDFDIPVHAARYGAVSGCSKFLFVSSVGADSKSGNFYLQLKGQVEEAVQAIAIPFIGAFRPSMLLGDRKEARPVERVMQSVTKSLSFLMPAKYKPIEAATVAEAMVAAAKQEGNGFKVYHYNEMKKLL